MTDLTEPERRSGWHPTRRGWSEIAILPRDRYIVIEEDDGWHVYSEDDHGVFS